MQTSKSCCRLEKVCAGCHPQSCIPSTSGCYCCRLLLQSSCCCCRPLLVRGCLGPCRSALCSGAKHGARARAMRNAKAPRPCVDRLPADCSRASPYWRC
jgi:hypothetical protein